MTRALKASVLYFLAVFAAGFVLGTVRMFWIVPRVGARAAELIETPIMLGVVVAAAFWIVRRMALEPRLSRRLGTGVMALAWVLIAEFALVLPLRGVSLAEYFVTLDPVPAAAYYGALGILAVMPLFVPPAIPGPGRAALVSALAVAAVLGGLVYARYRYDLRVELARVASGSSIALTPCGPIEYASLGEGPAVLLVHGAGGGFDQALDAANELAARGYRAVTLSRFGYLRTPLPPDASAVAQADAHACLLDALEIRRVAIVGVSAGAPSSMQFALRHRDRCTALVLLVPLAYAPRSGAPVAKPPATARFMFEHAVRSDFLFWLAMKTAPAMIVRTVLATPPEVLAGADADEQARVARLMRQILPLSERQEGLLNDISVASSLPRYELERIAVPALVVSVEDDLYGTFESARYTAQHIPGARFVGYRSGGHMWVGHHREVLAEMAAFHRATSLKQP